MPIYRDTRLASPRNPPTVDYTINRTYTPDGRCEA